jgi:AraC-like DNA-binding protein
VRGDLPQDVTCRPVKRLRSLAAVTTSLSRAKAPKERTFTHAHRQRMERAVAVYLRWCYQNKTAARASEFAERLGVQPQYLSSIAPKILQKPLRIFLRERQLAEAERLLTQTTLSVEEIALHAAFGTPMTLRRWFTKKHGVPPTHFRELKN